MADGAKRVQGAFGSVREAMAKAGDAVRSATGSSDDREVIEVEAEVVDAEPSETPAAGFQATATGKAGSKPGSKPGPKADPAPAPACDSAPKSAPASEPASASEPGPSEASARSPRHRHEAVLLAIFLGGLGAHKLYLGRRKAFLVQAAVFLVALWLGTAVLESLAPACFACLFGIVEGLVYLSLSDREFQRVYVAEGRDWL